MRLWGTGRMLCSELVSSRHTTTKWATAGILAPTCGALHWPWELFAASSWSWFNTYLTMHIAGTCLNLATCRCRHPQLCARRAGCCRRTAWAAAGLAVGTGGTTSPNGSALALLPSGPRCARQHGDWP